jgi:hypothetical protein
MKTVFVFILFALSAHASTDPACEKIQYSCGEAGYTRDVPGGKDLMENCFQPILKGLPVDGVKTDPEMLKKCNEFMDKNPNRGRNGPRHRGDTA